MYKYGKLGLSLLLSGVMASSAAVPAFAGQSSPTVTTGAVSEAGPGASGSSASAGSNVITVAPDSNSHLYSGPGASSGGASGGASTVQTGVGPSSSDSSTAVEPENPGSAAAEGSGAQTGGSSASASGGASSAAGETADPGTIGGGSELTESQANELEAEKQEGAAEAGQLNNPLSVPQRTPHLQSTVLLADSGSWSQPYVNSQQIEGASSGFSSISTFLEEIHGDILYRTYSSSNGWSGWAMNGQQSANAASLIPVEAIQYRFSGPVADQYDIYYTTVLSDGTHTGWAKNGQSAGTMNKGLYLTGYQLAFYPKNSAEAASLDSNQALVSDHADGIQVEDGVMKYIHGDGSSYTGWGWIGNDRYYFKDSLPVTGWQYIDGYKYYFQEDGKLVSDVESLLGSDGPYQIKVNKEMNCLTVYAQDGANGYIIPVKSFLTSVGDDTPLGTFTTPEKYRWRLMIHDVYTQYATRLGAGLPILIHSIIYDKPNAYTVWASTYNNLGIARSAGCIRLASADAKWVYDHCAVGTTVVVYNSEIPGPFERPTILYEIPFEQTWDPTDPNVTPEGIAAETARIMASFHQ